MRAAVRRHQKFLFKSLRGFGQINFAAVERFFDSASGHLFNRIGGGGDQNDGSVPAQHSQKFNHIQMVDERAGGVVHQDVRDFGRQGRERIENRPLPSFSAGDEFDLGEFL